MADNFMRVECDECGNRQNIYSRPATTVECLVCGEEVASPTGGRAEISGEIVKELEVE